MKDKSVRLSGPYPGFFTTPVTSPLHTGLEVIIIVTDQEDLRCNEQLLAVRVG